jgi:hypothetical protein
MVSVVSKNSILARLRPFLGGRIAPAAAYSLSQSPESEEEILNRTLVGPIVELECDSTV